MKDRDLKNLLNRAAAALESLVREDYPQGTSELIEDLLAAANQPSAYEKKVAMDQRIATAIEALPKDDQVYLADRVLALANSPVLKSGQFNEPWLMPTISRYAKTLVELEIARKEKQS